MELIRQHPHGPVGLQHLLEPQRIQLHILIQIGKNIVADDLVQHLEDLLVDIQAIQDLLALLINDLALSIHHIIVLQYPLPGLEMLGFYLPLRALDGP